MFWCSKYLFSDHDSVTIRAGALLFFLNKLDCSFKMSNKKRLGNFLPERLFIQAFYLG